MSADSSKLSDIEKVFNISFNLLKTYNVDSTHDQTGDLHKSTKHVVWTMYANLGLPWAEIL